MKAMYTLFYEHSSSQGRLAPTKLTCSAAQLIPVMWAFSPSGGLGLCADNKEPLNVSRVDGGDIIHNNSMIQLQLTEHLLWGFDVDHRGSI